MNYDKAHIRHCMLFQFHQSKNASQATKTICSVYGEDALVERTCRYWFARFTAGDFDLSDKERSGKARRSRRRCFRAATQRRSKAIGIGACSSVVSDE